MTLLPGKNEPGHSVKLVRRDARPSAGGKMHRNVTARRVAQLRTYYDRHDTVPSYAGLTKLWGYASKSSAAAFVRQLKREEILAESPGRRLRPGRLFFRADSSADRRHETGDPIDAAASRWALAVPDGVADAYGLTVRLLAVADLISQNARREPRPLGLNLGEVLVMDALRRLGPPFESSPGRLKDLFLISFAGIGKRLDRIERLGYIERRTNEKDRRGRIVSLTGAGLSLVRDGFRKRYGDHVIALLSLSQNERRNLSTILRHLQRTLGRRASTTVAGS
jgi:DNA-binding MarR family transcriptional regulator